MTARRLIAFDVDGTLIDSQDVIVASMTAAFEELGLSPPERTETLSIVGLSLREAIRTLTPASSDSELDALVSGYQQGFVAQRAAGTEALKAPLFPGARAALDRTFAMDDTALGVATGKARRGLDHVFATHDIGDYFVTAQTADDHPSKPHPSMLNRALAESGADAERAAMIGDTEFDVAMGRAAGFWTIAVTWGYHPVDRLKSAGADRIVETFEELVALLDGDWRRP